MTPDVEIAIVGAGLSGLGMGAALLHAGLDDFTILERADDVGGTWRDNTYPGVGVDIPTFAYQFTYALKPDWSRFFAKGHEVKQYVDDYVARFGLRPYVRLGADVRRRTWDEDAHLWRLTINDGEELTARFVIGAIGAFVDPKPPGIAGLDEFQGKVLHSARWDHTYDLTGKRVALVGTGASAVQIIPEIVDRVAQLDVYQRTPIWVGRKFDPKIPSAVQQLFRRVPLVQRVSYEIAAALVEFILVGFVVNYRRTAFAQRAVMRSNTKFINAQIKDPELRRKLTPDYGVGCKRPSVSNGYFKAFTKPHVTLITEPINRLTADAVSVNGEERQVDAVILATGFRLASDPENYVARPIHGKDGFDLATHYREQRLSSYEGITMPGLPNHFMMFGPYGWTGASWHVLVQTVSRHIVRVITEARKRDATCVEVTPEATAQFTRFAQDKLAGSLFFNGGCQAANSYYIDHHGDAPYLRPTSGRQAAHRAATFPLDDYRFSTSARKELAPA